jgi:hypothetical protein
VYANSASNAAQQAFASNAATIKSAANATPAG